MEPQDPNTNQSKAVHQNAKNGLEVQDPSSRSRDDQAMKSAAPASVAQDPEENDSEMQIPESDNIDDSGSALTMRNADLKIEDKKQVLKDFWNCCWADCQDGDYIDAMDSVQKWCLAQIIARDDSGVRCHFDGWSSRHDISYRWSSYKIAPFRRFSKGYSGQHKTPLRQNMAFSQDFMRFHIQQVNIFLQQDFHGFTAKQTTQYLRGCLFQACDFLLSANVYTEQEVLQVNEFFYQVIRLIVAWLKKVRKLIGKCFPELKQDTDLYMIDEDIAVVMSVCELMGILQRLFVGCHRCLKYYVHNDINAIPVKNPVTKDFSQIDFVQKRVPRDQEYDVDTYSTMINAKSEDLVFGQAANFLNYFAEQGGFEELLALIKTGNTRVVISEEQKKVDPKKEDNQNHLMPLDYLGELTGAFLNCRGLMSPEFAGKFVDELRLIITERLVGMSDKEIKELDKEALAEVLLQFNQLLLLSKAESETHQQIEQMQLSFSVRFMKTTYLEKRLKGISDLRTIIERVDAKSFLDKTDKKGRPFILGPEGQKIKPTQFLDQAIVKEYILKEKVAETLFGEGAHSEILKRAAPIIRFLCQQGAITQQIIDMIWNCQQGKHEETVRVVYALINEVVPNIPEPLLDNLFAKISSVPQDQYQEMYLDFLKEFTIRALGTAESIKEQRKRAKVMQNMEELAAIEDRETRADKLQQMVFADLGKALSEPEKMALLEGQKLYGMPILWGIIQDTFKSTGEVKSSEILALALGSLCEILAQPLAPRAYYLLKCIQNLKACLSLYPSACIIISIIQVFESHAKRADTQLFAKEAIQNLEEQLNLVDLIISSVTGYDQHVKEAIKVITRKNKAPIEKIEDYIFYGRSAHKEVVEKLLDFIQFVIIGSDYTVSVKCQNIDILWKIFVHQPNFTQDQTLFLQFINQKRKSYNRGEVTIFTPQEQKHLFCQILCNNSYVDYQRMSSGLAKCFHTYFKYINRDQGSLDISRKKVEVIDFEQLLGMDSLWQICFDSENEKAREESRELLVQLHLGLNEQRYNAAMRQKIMQAYLDRAMTLLGEYQEGAERKARSIIQAVIDLLDRFEGKKPIRPELKLMAQQYGNFQPWPIQILFRGETQNREARLQISQFESLGSVRQKCAALFGMEQNEFHMQMKSGFVDPDEDDDRYVKDHDMSLQVLLSPNITYDKSAHPKYLLSANQVYFDQLFSLLTKNSGTLTESVWNLLQMLPINGKLHNDLSQLQGDLNVLFDSKSTHKLLYSLKIFEEMKFQNNQDGISDLQTWKQKFIEMGGFDHILVTFSSLPIDSIDSKLTLKCISSLVDALFQFVLFEPTLNNNILEKKDRVITTCVRYIHLIAKFSLKVEELRGESYEDLQLKRAQKRLAKQKERQLQGPQKSRGRRNDEDSDANDDEFAQQFQMIQDEFHTSKVVVERLFTFMNQFIFNHDKMALLVLQKYPELEDFIKVIMLKNENYQIRIEAGKQIRQILVNISGVAELQPTMTAILRAFLIEIIPSIKDTESRCTEYIFQARKTIEDLQVSDFAQLDGNFNELIKHLATSIQNREIKEINTKSEDKVLVGMMTILNAILQKYPARKKDIGAMLVPHLLHDCLFEIPQRSGFGSFSMKPKCKSFHSRNGALRLLTVLSRDCLENLHLVLEYITKFSRQASWRTNKTSDWQITHQDDEKSSTGYCGLKNLGCICYMISLFQQLFMVPSFREDLLAVDDPNYENQEPDENMFYQLQAIFSGLLKSEKQYVNPKGFCHAFKDWEGQPTNVMEQMDVEEFLQMFFDRLETAIKGTPQEKTIQAHFGGKLANEMICQGCPHQYERPEPFLSLGVPVKNKKSILEGLNAFIQGDMLEGDNAYFCAKCDKKVDTLKRQCIKELPRYLIVSLKRFEFDFDRMIRVKINDYCEFPMELDMFPYTQEGLSRKEKAAKKKREALDRGEEAQEEEEEPLKYHKDYYMFKLKGIVVHTGTADSGHYYSFIKEATQNGERWYEFNDNIVSDFEASEIANECFGGEDSGIGLINSQMRNQKWRNAYLVIYERKDQSQIQHQYEEIKDPDNEKKEVGDREAMIEDDIFKKGVKLNDPEHPIQQKIRLENQKYWQNKFLFGKEYFDFVTDVTHYWNTARIVPFTVLNKNDDAHICKFQNRQGQDPNMSPNDQRIPLDKILDLRTQFSDEQISDASHNIFKFATTFYLTILQRAQYKVPVPKLMNALKAYINNDPRNGEWLITEFSNWEIINEMLLQTQQKEMPKLTVGLLYCAMITIYEKEKANLNIHWVEYEQSQKNPNQVELVQSSVGPLGNFILLLISHIYDIRAVSYNIPHYFQILARFASLGPEAREFLLKAKIVGRCMDFFYDSASPYRQQFSNFADLGPFVEKNQPDIGLPTVLDKKVRTYFQVLQERRRRQALSNAVPKYKYLIELVSLCVRHLQVCQSPTPFQLDADYEPKIKAFLAIQEADIFIPEARFLKRFFVEAKRNRSIWALAKAHCHYAYHEEGDQLEELFRTVEAGLIDQDFDCLRPFLCLFEALIDGSCPNFSSRVASYLQRFVDTVKLNISYYKWMEVIFEFIFKIVGKHQHVREWFYANEASWKFLIDWVGTNQRQPGGAQNPGVYLFKQQNRNNMQGYDHISGRSAVNAAYRVRKLQEMVNKQVTDTKNEPDLDRLDMQDFKFLIGDSVSIYDRKRDDVDQYRVITVLDEMISLESFDYDSNNKKTTRWQKCDTDKLLFGETYYNLQRTQLRKEILIQRQQQRAAEASRGYQARAVNDENMEAQWNGSESQQRTNGGRQQPATGNAPNNDLSEYGSSEEEQADLLT